MKRHVLNKISKSLISAFLCIKGVLLFFNLDVVDKFSTVLILIHKLGEPAHRFRFILYHFDLFYYSIASVFLLSPIIVFLHRRMLYLIPILCQIIYLITLGNMFNGQKIKEGLKEAITQLFMITLMITFPFIPKKKSKHKNQILSLEDSSKEGLKNENFSSNKKKKNIENKKEKIKENTKGKGKGSNHKKSK